MFSSGFSKEGKKEKWKAVRDTKSKHFFNWHYFLLLFYILLLLVSPVSTETPDGIIISEADYQGLQAFKHSIEDPRGVLRSWNDTGIGACSGAWVGVKCVKGQVIAIQLPWRVLGGKITEKIGQLVALRKLSLHDNSIGCQIPSAIGFLPRLRGLYLFNNRFSGTIPPSIGDMFSDVVGSPFYVAPEVLRESYDPKADVWSAGVILYILLSGVPPFWAETEAGICKQILKGPLDFESEPWPHISDSAKDLIQKMLCRDPKKRPTAYEVLCHQWIAVAGVFEE